MLLLIHLGGGQLEQLGGSRQDTLAHERRGIGHIGIGHRIARPVIGAGLFHHCGIDGQLALDKGHQLAHPTILFGGAQHGFGGRYGSGIDGLVIAIAVTLGFHAGLHEAGGGHGIGHRERTIKVVRRVRHRLGGAQQLV